MGTEDHKKKAKKTVTAGIFTLSSTRTIALDESGKWIRERLLEEGHQVVFHQVLPDDPDAITRALLKMHDLHGPDAVILTGGTGIAQKDITIEAVRPLLDKEMPGFGVLFAMESHREIGSSAILSRALAGTMKETVVFIIPGSLSACRVACEKLIFPELGHIAMHLKTL